MQPCLPVGRRRKRHEEEEHSFDNVGTMEATEYLRMVQSQANQLPDVFVARAGEMDTETTKTPKQNGHDDSHHHKQSKRATTALATGSAAAAQYLVSPHTDLLPPPTVNHTPAAKRVWADRTLDAFSRLRVYLEELHEAGGGRDRAVALPPMKERGAWHVFCVGKDDAEGNAGAYYGEDEDEEADEDNGDGEEKEDVDRKKNGTSMSVSNKAEEGEDIPAWEQGLHETQDGHYWPTTSLVLQMDQVMVRKVLSHLTYFVCQGWDLTPARSAWIYALLARLERSVHRDDAVVLFQLLKRLTVVRSQQQPQPLSDYPNSNNNDLARINTLILILGTYFEQGGGYTATMEPKAT